jgi:NAD(P)H-flavin reductase/formate hydrogenlyase subunit 6/NADH:ubiquinone oxidoreductase subunit I
MVMPLEPQSLPATVRAWDESARFMPRERLDDLLGALRATGRRVIGPVVEDGALKMVEIDDAEELPFGWTAESAPGTVRLTRNADGAAGADRAFDNGPAWRGLKAWMFPSRVESLGIELTDDGHVSIKVNAPEPSPIAVIGARACDLAALAVHDRVLQDGPAVDPDYAARRRGLFIVGVECALATSTCFCTSMGTGPEVTAGADIVLAEVTGGFAARAGSPAGARTLEGLRLGPAAPAQLTQAAGQVAATRVSMGNPVQAEGLHERLLANLDHPRWDAIAERCLACANCTLVCPTCFCTGIEVASDLDGRESTTTRSWDSCFTAGYAQVAGGGSFRPRRRDRYRQWLTHKFGTWWDQFGTSGCVGCGRCIAWCPVGIDVREELSIIAAPPTPGERATAAPSMVGAPLPVLTNPLEPGSVRTDYVTVRVSEVRPETGDTTTLVLATDDAALLTARPGQFVMVAMPAFAIPPISISRVRADGLELTIRAAGPATSALARLRPGTELGLRGPLGRPWPIDDAAGRDVVIVGGGIGLAPLRGVIDTLIAQRERFHAIRIYVGARTPRDRLFVAELDALAARDDLVVRTTVDRAGADWLGRVGIVTQLFPAPRPEIDGSNVTAFVCGPERMMTATADALGDIGVPPEHVWLTLERRMECGVGLCGHCQLGTRFVCRDGPVFSVAELGPDLRREGL